LIAIVGAPPPPPPSVVTAPVLSTYFGVFEVVFSQMSPTLGFCGSPEVRPVIVGVDPKAGTTGAVNLLAVSSLSSLASILLKKP
jgi:hypothetical protein